MTVLDGKIEQLKQVILFRGLSQPDIDEIGSLSKMSSCTRGHLLYHPTETGQALFILKEGRVRIFKLSPEGKELTLANIGPGSVFGEMALLGKSMHQSFAQVTENAIICKIRYEDLEQLLAKKPQISLRLLKLIGERNQTLENRLYFTSLNDVPHQVANLLLELMEENGKPDKLLTYSHEELAKMIGTSRESVTLALGNFKDSGWIETSNRQIKINDTDSLRNFTES